MNTICAASPCEQTVVCFAPCCIGAEHAMTIELPEVAKPRDARSVSIR